MRKAKSRHTRAPFNRLCLLELELRPSLTQMVIKRFTRAHSAKVLGMEKESSKKMER